MRRIAAATFGLVGALVGVAALAGPAHAQDGGEAPPAEVDISFDTGGYDAGRRDFLITVVEIRGGLREGEEFTVELGGSGGRVLWSATRVFTAPLTRVEVDEKVAVGDVTSASVSQRSLEVVLDAVSPDVPSAVEGTGGSGQLTLSMLVTIVVVAVVFRSPLPSAQTSRWTK